MVGLSVVVAGVRTGDVLIVVSLPLSRTGGAADAVDVSCRMSNPAPVGIMGRDFDEINHRLPQLHLLQFPTYGNQSPGEVTIGYSDLQQQKNWNRFCCRLAPVRSITTKAIGCCSLLAHPPFWSLILLIRVTGLVVA